MREPSGGPHFYFRQALAAKLYCTIFAPRNPLPDRQSKFFTVLQTEDNYCLKRFDKGPPVGNASKV